MVFVDLEKAYDTVPQKVLWWALKEQKVHAKYVALIRATYRESSTYLRSAAGNTNQFGVFVGFYQKSTLNPYFFPLVIGALKSNI